MKTQITAEQFKATILPSVTKPQVFTPYVSKPVTIKKRDVSALQASLERGRNNG